MELLLVSMYSSDSFYNYIYQTRSIKTVDPAQKFYRNLIFGLADCSEDINITCIASPPVSKGTHKKGFWERQEETVGRIKYIVPQFRNGLFSRFIDQKKNIKIEFLKWLEDTKCKERVVLCDPLVVHATSPILKYCRKNNIKTCAIVTDLPLLWMQMGEKKGIILSEIFNYVYSFWADLDIKKYDSYVWLTEQMNKYSNKHKRPYVVIEGFADVALSKYNSEKSEPDLPNRFAMYAGGIHKVFRIDLLIEAFVKADVKETELLIFGNGNDVDAVKEYEKKYSNVKYMGVVDSTALAKIEKKAVLLINPRPTKDEYTKYSFPSKTIEYLGSGTAVLSTRLKGIPSDYEDYLYWFEEENVDGMASVLNKVLSKDDQELKLFGANASEFIKREKNAKKQAEKIIALLNEIMN